MRKSYASFVKFVPKLFILFDTFVSVILFLNFLDCSLLVYTDIIDRCVLFFYPATVLDSFIIYYTFLHVYSLRFPIYILQTLLSEGLNL